MPTAPADPICDEELALLKAIAADPEERTVRLAYVDWLTERDDAPARARLEFIRVQTELETVEPAMFERLFDAGAAGPKANAPDPVVQRHAELRRIEHGLLDAYADRWAGLGPCPECDDGTRPVAVRYGVERAPCPVCGGTGHASGLAAAKWGDGDLCRMRGLGYAGLHTVRFRRGFVAEVRTFVDVAFSRVPPADPVMCLGCSPRGQIRDYARYDKDGWCPVCDAYGVYTDPRGEWVPRPVALRWFRYHPVEAVVLLDRNNRDDGTVARTIVANKIRSQLVKP